MLYLQLLEDIRMRMTYSGGELREGEEELVWG